MFKISFIIILKFVFKKPRCLQTTKYLATQVCEINVRKGVTNSNQNAPFGPSGPIQYIAVHTDSNKTFFKLTVRH